MVQLRALGIDFGAVFSDLMKAPRKEGRQRQCRSNGADDDARGVHQRKKADGEGDKPNQRVNGPEPITDGKPGRFQKAQSAA